MSDKPKATADKLALKLVIYLNENFVNGLYSSLFDGIHGDIEKVSKNSSDKQRKSGIKTKLKAMIPFTGGASVAANIDELNAKNSEEQSKQTTTYGNAYRLEKVLNKLSEESELTIIDSEDSFSKTKTNEFVSFRAFFAKNEILELLDVITPELANILTYVIYTNTLQNQSVNNEDFEQKFNQKIVEGYQVTAFQTVQAIKKDFANDHSSEFFGKLVDHNDKEIDVMCDAICDNLFFTNGDTERILDGVFHVVGKVIQVQDETSERTITQFDRNKLLKRIKPDGLAALEAWLTANAPKNDYYDLSLSLTIKGKAFKVIPVAIYA